jgi:cyclopropane fatty-acyl-phospholipid synthase-like methyltransferase
MNDTEFRRIAADPQARTANYERMVVAYYDRVTDTYRRAWGDSFHFALFSGAETLAEAMVATERRLADEGGFGPGMRVLDIGCGVGGPALNIAEHSGAHVTGVNVVPHQVEIARRRAAKRGLAERTHFEVADGMSMPFPDGAFDAVYIFEAGCHMPDKARFYVECARVLRPGGVFLGLEWLQRDGLTASEAAQHIEPICRCFAVPHLATLAELERYLEAAGLLVEVVEDVSASGNILRNWELVDAKNMDGVRSFVPTLVMTTVKALRSIAPGLLPPALRILTDGGVALTEAARAGAFLIGHWRARKPAVGDR